MNYVVIQPNHISEKIRVEISEKKTDKILARNYRKYINNNFCFFFGKLVNNLTI